MQNAKLQLKNKNFPNFKREFSAGCVVFKREKRKNKNAKSAKIKFLLGKHSGYHKWVLPKGLIEEGERGWQTAVRETEEEMGVKAKLVSDKPIHIEKYVFYANYKDQQNTTMQQCNKATIDNSQNTRRVEKYKESFDSAQDEGGKTKVFKTVAFYLAEYVSGSPEDHGWEMSEAGWFDYENALDLMAFKGEKAALIKAYNILYIRSEKTPIRQLADGDESAKMERRRRDWDNR